MVGLNKVSQINSKRLSTELRRQEAATLKWQNVDLESKTLTIEDTKK